MLFYCIFNKERPTWAHTHEKPHPFIRFRTLCHSHWLQNRITIQHSTETAASFVSELHFKPCFKVMDCCSSSVQSWRSSLHTASCQTSWNSIYSVSLYSNNKHTQQLCISFSKLVPILELFQICFKILMHLVRNKTWQDVRMWITIICNSLINTTLRYF